MSCRYLLIPDAGPLISLAKANCLDLLCKLKDSTLLVPDAVFIETTFEKKYKDSQNILDFLLKNAAILFTPAGYTLLASKYSPLNPRLRGSGETSILQSLRNLQDQDIFWTKANTMIIFEDTGIINNLQQVVASLKGKTRFVSTPSYICLLEKIGLIPSADAVFNTMKKCNVSIDYGFRHDQEVGVDIKQK